MRALCAGILFLLAGPMLASCGGEPSPEEATREALEALAEDGDAGALVALGQMYEKGLSTEPDYFRAYDLYEAASEEGDALAPYRLGELYARGFGVARDYGEAARWYALAGARGNAAALVALGRLYEDGWGVRKDYAEAARLYEKAAAIWRASGDYPMDSTFAPREVLQLVAPAPAGSSAAAPLPAEQAGAADDAASAGGTAAAPAKKDRPVGCKAEPPLEPAPALGLHLASFRLPANAAEEWRRLCALEPALLGDLAPLIVRVDLGEAGVFHRLLAGPFERKEKAAARCRALEARGHFCAVLARPGA